MQLILYNINNTQKQQKVQFIEKRKIYYLLKYK
jgi:hypothetical protein